MTTTGGFALRIQRLYTVAGEDVYARIPFVSADLDLLAADGGTVHACYPDVEIPADWSHGAVAAMLECGLCLQDVPQKLRAVEENTVPSWLWRCVPDQDDTEIGYERSFKRVFDRIAGALTYTGWKAGYFNAEADAHAFYDEWRYMLARQMLALPAAYGELLGLHWAYGFEGRAGDGVWLDPRSNRLRVRAAHYAQPQILTPVGQSAAMIVSPHDPAVAEQVARHQATAVSATALQLGTRLLQGQLDTLYRAAQAGDSAAALTAARQMGVAESLIAATLERAQQGQPALDLSVPQGQEPPVRDYPAQFVLREKANEAGWAESLNALWHYNEPGVLFAPVAREWSSLPLTMTGVSGAAVLPLEAAFSQATLNLRAFLRDSVLGGGFDHVGFAHASKLATLALDLLLQHSSYPDEQMARQTLAVRPLALGFSDLASTLLALGYGYDTPAARALAAAITALMTGTAVVASGELAASLGTAEEFAENREALLRVLRNQRRAAYGETENYEALSAIPQSLNLTDCPDLPLLAAVRRVWDQAVELGHTMGMRNLHFTALDAVAENMLDTLTGGVLPLPALLEEWPLGDDVFVRQPVAGFYAALEQLGYDTHEQRAIIAQLVGWRSLADAPLINHQTLSELGFDEAALARVESALQEAVDIHHAVHPWVLGQAFCTQVLGLTTEQWEDPTFDLLAKLGFSAEAVAAAQAYCCGGAAPEHLVGIAPEHRAVFACRDAFGAGGLTPEAVLRMAGSVQPFVSGLVATPMALADEALLATTAALLEQAESLGLKSFMLRRAAVVEAMKSASADAATITLPDTLKPLRRVGHQHYVRSTHRADTVSVQYGARLKVRISSHSVAEIEPVN